MDNKNTFAIRMREARLKADLSQAELSRRTKIAAATLSTYESTDSPKNPPIDKAIAIAQELNVSLDWLCGLDNPKNYSDKPTVEEVLDAIITLSKLSFSDIDTTICNGEYKKFVVIKLLDDGLYDFAKEFMKVKHLMDNPDYPDYLKIALKNALYDKFA